jgi:hypothetical protein
MLARAKRNSESTIATQLGCVVAGNAVSLHPYKNGDKHITTNYRPIFYYPHSPKFIQNLILETPIKI